MHIINQQQLLKTDLYHCWNFFSDPAKLSDITPEWLSFRVISNLSKQIYAGMIIEYKISPFKYVNVRWVTEITHVDKPYYFVDEQRFGPYKFWHHKHFFEETDGGILMTDEVHYMLPFKKIGVFAHSCVVKNKLNNIFTFRKNKLEKLFG